MFYNQLTDFYEVQYGVRAIKVYRDSILRNIVASTIPNYRELKLLRWI
jgi:hypothetical protein